MLRSVQSSKVVALVDGPLADFFADFFAHQVLREMIVHQASLLKAYVLRIEVDLRAQRF